MIPMRPSVNQPPRTAAHTVPNPPSLPQSAVSIRGLTKVYAPSNGTAQPKKALDQVDLEIPRGSLFALLGPNGAGKSTLINILAQLVIKTSGQVTVWDIALHRDPRPAQRATRML